MNAMRTDSNSVRELARRGLWVLGLLILGVASSCTLDNPQAPDLAGPSTAAHAIEVRAIPETLVSDGFSSSVIEAILYGPNGERLSGATIRFEIVAQGQFLDLGNLAPVNGPRPGVGSVEAGPVSATTDGNGVARVRYWAPFRTDQENDTTVTIAAREQSTNIRGQLLAQADIFLRAANRASFPGTDACGFTVEPVKPAYKIGEPITFIATQVTGACGPYEIARYEWNIEPDTYREGRDIVHAFAGAGTFDVFLTTTEAVSGCQESCFTSVAIVP
jgi:hypothetical protein